MKTIGIVPNFDKDTQLKNTKKIVNFLLERGCKPIFSYQVGEHLKNKEYSRNIEEVYQQSDFIIALGGDGTLLSVARKASLSQIPILGINLGTLGFLTDVEMGEADIVLDKVINGNYKSEKRMMLEATMLTHGTNSEINIALNDICVTRGVFSRLIDLNIYVNDQFLDSYKADGVIVSTPTGSTAYNLSAGGPILKPDTEMVAITPICSHTLYSRSAVVSSSDIIKLEVRNFSNTDILMSADGQTGVALKKGDIVEIKKSKFYTSIIKTNDLNFYDILRKKMINVRK